MSDIFSPVSSDTIINYNFTKMLNKLFREKNSDSAKLVYTYILSRLSLSIKNHWSDDEEKIYVILPISEVMEVF